METNITFFLYSVEADTTTTTASMTFRYIQAGTDFRVLIDCRYLDLYERVTWIQIYCYGLARSLYSLNGGIYT